MAKDENDSENKIDSKNEIPSAVDDKTANKREPSLKEDYEALRKMNLLRNLMVRIQYGRFPNKEIDGVLKRRMDFDESKYQGSRVARIIISLLALFFICTFTYIAIWLLASSMSLNSLKESASLVISLFFLSACGFVIFNNFSVPDEKKLKIAIKERMTEIEIELNIKKKGEGKTSNASLDHSQKQS